MKKFLTAAAVVAIMTAAPAFAQSKTATTEVSVTVNPDCEITSNSSALTLTTVNAPVLGQFSYSCNFVGNPSVTIQSLNGGVLNPDNGTDKANYGVYLNDQAPTGTPDTWAQASDLQAGHTYTGNDFLTETAPNAVKSPSFYVGLTQPVTVAGTYSDTLTFTIAP